VVYVTGAELLTQLEASAQGLPFTPETYMLAASFMHVSGIEYTINTAVSFNAGEPYRDRIWYTAASVGRVQIISINGNPFDETALYAIITSNANFNGMDISYVLAARESDIHNHSTITTARVVDHAVTGFIASLPNATIGQDYAGLQGRITLTDAVDRPTSDNDSDEDEYLTRGAFVNMLFESFGNTGTDITNTFVDVPASHLYAQAISWATEQSIINGVTATSFAPDRYITRQEVAVLIYRLHTSPAVDGSLHFIDFSDIAPWAYEAVLFMVSNGFMRGVSHTVFAPLALATRSLGVVIILSI